jgi:hypothetical protein
MKMLLFVLILLLASCKPPPDTRSLVYLISVSRITYREADKWLVEYAIDGKAQAVELPIKPNEPDGFMDYLKTVGRLTN